MHQQPLKVLHTHVCLAAELSVLDADGLATHERTPERRRGAATGIDLKRADGADEDVDGCAAVSSWTSERLLQPLETLAVSVRERAGADHRGFDPILGVFACGNVAMGEGRVDER